MTFRKVLAGIVLVLSAASALAASTEDALDRAKASGLVGEDATGYLAAVNERPSADIDALVKEINEKRRLQYEKIAEKNGIALADVEQLAARKAIEKTESGNYIRLPGGGWQKK